MCACVKCVPPALLEDRAEFVQGWNVYVTGGLLLFFPQITLSLKTQSMSSIRHMKQQWQVI